MLTINDIAADLQVSRSYVYVLAKGEDFPRPVQLSAKVKRWLPSEYDAWKKRLRRER